MFKSRTIWSNYPSDGWLSSTTLPPSGHGDHAWTLRMTENSLPTEAVSFIFESPAYVFFVWENSQTSPLLPSRHVPVCPTLTLLLRHLSRSDSIWFPCLSCPPDGLARLKSLRQEKESYFSLHPRCSSHTELMSDLPGVCWPVGSLFESLVLESQTSSREVFPPSFLPSNGNAETQAIFLLVAQPTKITFVLS